MPLILSFVSFLFYSPKNTLQRNPLCYLYTLLLIFMVPKNSIRILITFLDDNNKLYTDHAYLYDFNKTYTA